jgi:hypothetical protein
MIISKVRIEVGALEIKIVAPGLMIPLVALVNPNTQEDPRKQPEKPDTDNCSWNHLCNTFPSQSSQQLSSTPHGEWHQATNEPSGPGARLTMLVAVDSTAFAFLQIKEPHSPGGRPWQ